jgi:hypothetical protein
VAPEVDEKMELSEVPVIGISCSAEIGLPVSPAKVTIVFAGRPTDVENWIVMVFPLLGRGLDWKAYFLMNPAISRGLLLLAQDFGMDVRQPGMRSEVF